MDIKTIVNNLKNCSCGRVHNVDLECVEISSGATAKVAEVLDSVNFPKKVLVVADRNTVAASGDLFDRLIEGGFEFKQLIYENMKYAKIEQVREVEELLKDVDGVISVGTGSLNDICRVASYNCGTKLCIFATAPSMDGFASDTAPIVVNNFKASFQAKQPNVILADTKILAKSPIELKSAGFGDMVAKYIGVFEWQVANLLIDEYYCPEVAELTMESVRKMVALADKVTGDDEEAAGAIMEALVMSGTAMKFACCSRPASGAEHVVSHYWECYKLARGIWPEFHGKKVGVATVIINRAYRKLFDTYKTVSAHEDTTDWDAVYAAFSPEQIPEVRKLNTPTITDKIDPRRLSENWGKIRELAYNILPTDEELMRIMKLAGAATELDDIHVSDELLEAGMRYHSYMRYRLLITRILPMLGIDIMELVK
ncbi:MAG: iron-containing alcohol dehydrogenase [Clostridia bacterium]|nr:iron-containing alcohol dehydrogenase [Clostridia bacterium]